MKKNVLFLLTIFLLVNFSCKKKCECIDELPHEFLSYWCFDQGSWWVYQLKDTTNVFDTVTITKSELFANGTENDGYYYPCTEYSNCDIIHSNSLFSDHINNSKSEGYSSSSKGDKENYSVFVDSKIYFSDFLSYSTIQGFIMENNKYWKLIDMQSVQTPTNTFNNILHYVSSDSLHYFFSKNVGIVKRITSDGNTWELINYNVIQNY